MRKEREEKRTEEKQAGRQAVYIRVRETGEKCVREREKRREERAIWEAEQSVISYWDNQSPPKQLFFILCCCRALKKPFMPFVDYPETSS